MRNETPLRIIAEIGVNHNGEVDLAKRLVDEAQKAGATAVKFQTFDVDSIIVKNAPKATYHIETTGTDDHGSWYQLLQSQALTKAEFQCLFEYSRELGLEFISTPYDIPSANLLRDIGCSTVKIASTDVNNFPLLRAVCEFSSEVILSTGMSDLSEVLGAMSVLSEKPVDKITLLQCTSNYPVPLDQSNIAVLNGYRSIFGERVSVGFSDHVLSDIPSIMAVALGARTFEKHITLDKTMLGPDHRSSLTPAEFSEYTDALLQAYAALGDGIKRVMPCERENKSKLQKFVVANRRVAVGETIDQEAFGLKRNGGIGLSAFYWDQVEGKRVCRVIESGDSLGWKDIES